jgi:hypothetical protein
MFEHLKHFTPFAGQLSLEWFWRCPHLRHPAPFLGTIDNKCKASTKKFCINNKELNFKIDTGADVTVISDNDFKGIKLSVFLVTRSASTDDKFTLLIIPNA